MTVVEEGEVQGIREGYDRMREEEASNQGEDKSDRAVPRSAPRRVDSDKSLQDLNRTIGLVDSGSGSGTMRRITSDFIGPIIESRQGKEAASRNPGLSKSAHRKRDRYASQPPPEDILPEERYVANPTPNHNERRMEEKKKKRKGKERINGQRTLEE